jgi:esterase/lipase superfamily enzyme
MQPLQLRLLALGLAAIVLSRGPWSAAADPEEPTGQGKLSRLASSRELTELARIRIFYATDRRSNAGLVLDGRWYARHFSSTGGAALATLLFGWIARRCQRWSWRLITIVGLVGTVFLGGMACNRWVHLSGGPVDPAQLYGPERSDQLHLGTAVVSIPREHQLGTLESPSIIRFQFTYNPSKHVLLQDHQSCQPEEFYRLLKDNVERSRRKELFVFVHGYNVTFHDAVRRTAQLAYDLEFDGVPILYSWPSQGELLQYTVDESNVEWTVHNLKHFLQDLSSRSGAQTIHLIAHSMGNRALAAALRALATDPDYNPAPFQQVVLAAPDIDAETFKREIAPAIRKIAGRVTLYASSRDEALAVSKQIHGYPRAGESGDKLVVLPGIDTIDVSTVDTSFIGHSYYGNNRSLLADLFALLNKSLPPVQRDQLQLAQRDELPYWVFQPNLEASLE